MRQQVINGVPVTNQFPAHILRRPDLVEADAELYRRELETRAAVNHPDPSFRAAEADLAVALRSLDRRGFDPQGYPKGWTGPRSVDANWKPTDVWDTTPPADDQRTPSRRRTR